MCAKFCENRTKMVGGGEATDPHTHRQTDRHTSVPYIGSKSAKQTVTETCHSVTLHPTLYKILHLTDYKQQATISVISCKHSATVHHTTEQWTFINNLYT